MLDLELTTYMLQSQPLKKDLVDFIDFFIHYIQTRLFLFGGRFEQVKDIVVAILITKRGKYSQSFLNTSFLLLVSATFIGGPIVAENNPFLAEYVSDTEATTYENVFYTDMYTQSLKTRFSVKPRDRVETYIIKSGDTLKSISDKFDISVDTIKWQNKLKSDVIKPGEKLEIPPITGIVHKVAPGETIYSIAKKYKVDPQVILNYQFNDFVDIDTFALASGQTLVVPNGVIEEARPGRGIIRPRAPAIAAGTAGTGSFIWPTSGTISQYPIWYHMAVDLSNRSLPDVIASDTGTVTYAGCVGGGYGCHVIINHSNGYQTLYGHLSRIDVSVGQGISRGVTLGRVGSTGRSTGPHLHFEIRQNGVLQNPLSYLR